MRLAGIICADLDPSRHSSALASPWPGRLTSMFGATEALAECERSLKDATNCFRPRRNIGLPAAKALYGRNEISFEFDLYGQVGRSRG